MSSKCLLDSKGGRLGALEGPSSTNLFDSTLLDIDMSSRCLLDSKGGRLGALEGSSSTKLLNSSSLNLTAKAETPDSEEEYELDQLDPGCFDLSAEACNQLSERARKTLKNSAYHSKSFYPGSVPHTLVSRSKSLNELSAEEKKQKIMSQAKRSSTNPAKKQKVL
ncbi:hypothetical protein PtA15_9A514 [Puccinia triticina]|uniref:Uncharacterized protein n=1 Tax=Puccinia triticina TaxID=208348 RepID=A0ABY7CVB5_9BASI|nr:uncharacterized protein PtA15_9A514 [Puccinia triticina]WAQ88387.1 hypothetical protein PtA15_9A514 [Puccinia triticina]